MAIEITDKEGKVHNLPSRGAAYAGLGLGIAGTALGVLNGGLGGGGGLLGGNGDVTQREATVGVVRYFEDRIRDLERTNDLVGGLQQQICDLKERTAVNETASAFIQKLNEVGFGNVDTRFATERMITDYEIAAKTCRMLTADLYLSPNQLANSYKGHTQVLESYTAREDLPGRGFNNCGTCNGGF